MPKEQEIKWSKLSSDIYERFAVELGEGLHDGADVTSGDQDVRYGIELQQKRLNDKGLTMYCDFVPRGQFSQSSSGSAEWKDEHYKSRTYWRTCQWKRLISAGDKQISAKQEKVVLYQTVTDVISGEHMDEEFYSCSNCGANVKIKELTKGCPYCNTFFKMDELYPKISNYYILKDYGRTSNELKREILKFVIPAIIVAIIGYTLDMHYSPEMSKSWGSAIIIGILSGIIAGGLFGYVLWAISLIARLFIDAGKAVSILSKTSGSNKRFENYMKRYSPEFSYTYFTGKVVSLVKIIIFSDNPDELPVYEGEMLGNRFDNLIDTSFNGAVACKNMKEQDGIITLSVEAFMTNTYESGGKIIEKDETVRLTMKRRTGGKLDYHFSIKKLQCINCGGSFDATKNRICPYCGSPYQLEDMDWIVTSIKM